MDAAPPPVLPTPAAGRSFLLGFVVFVVAGLAAAAVLFCFDPARCSFYPFCWFHRATGLLCPGCGSLRALHQLLHGHLAAAFQLNPLLVVGLPVAILVAGRGIVRRFGSQPAAAPLSPLMIWGLLVISIVFTVCRNVPAICGF
jgi:hypothetical protein